MRTKFIIPTLLILCTRLTSADEQVSTSPPTLEELKATGPSLSTYLKKGPEKESDNGAPKADLIGFKKDIEPILSATCWECHGPDKEKGDLRIDTLDPDILYGEDTGWWLDTMEALTNDEMPPEDGPKLTDDDRNKIITWISSQIQAASQVQRDEQSHTSFRRMARYEYNYALQDLLGLPLDFAGDLPPDPVSEDGFQNSSEMLKISVSQYNEYLKLNRDALKRATVRGAQPKMLHWAITPERAATRRVRTRQQLDAKIGRVAPDAPKTKVPEPVEKKIPKSGKIGKGPYYKNPKTGHAVPAKWAFRRAVHAWPPSATLAQNPAESDYIGIIPAGQRLIYDLGNQLPDEGILRVRIRGSRTSAAPNHVPSLALEFGWQGSNQSLASVKISNQNLIIDSPPGEYEFYQWDIPLSEIYPRNPVRKTIALGTPKLTNPSEYIRLHNVSKDPAAIVEFDYVEISTPVYEQWPPASHQQIFIASENSDDENLYAREIILNFMQRAWRRNITDAEIDRKMSYFTRIRPSCTDFQESIIEVLATVLSSPRFLYLIQSEPTPYTSNKTLDDFEIATRLSMFLWCSTPDATLLELAKKGQLNNPEELIRQTQRMLKDPKHHRFTQRFVRQWLNMDLLNFLNIDKSAYPKFNNHLKEAMQQEPVAFFEELLKHDHSVMDFIHADYAVINQELAKHYDIENVHGSHFRKVALKPEDNRGGLLTQAGLLAMNSDGKDSHPLKRGIWLLESILNDPPPPPPAEVAEIDLTDPEILKMTLKERMEDHRNKPACASCHVKIDPWGVAFENFDAVGKWRTKYGEKDVDSMGLLFNKHELDGMNGLKRFLLTNRQDQFARAMVHKMTTFALGRPLSFSDRSRIGTLTSDLRKRGDGLNSLVEIIVTSELFKSH